MKKFNIIVTAVGAVVGYGIVEALRLSGFPVNIIGTDIFPDAVGQYMCDDFVVSEPAASDGYLDFLCALIDKKHADLVLFGIEQELMTVSRNRELLGGYMDRIAINPASLCELCNDKWLMHGSLLEKGLSRLSIDSAVSGSFDELAHRFGVPFLLKPRCDRASKGINSVSAAEDFEYYKKKMGNSFMAQRIVGDAAHEYTVGLFGLADGTFSDSLTMRRTLSQEGATAKAEVVVVDEINAATEALTRAYSPVGPTNYQFRIENGRPFLLEINPRISSSISIRSKFGFNEAKMCIEYYLLGRRPDPAVIKKGRAVRYIKDWMVFE